MIINFTTEKVDTKLYQKSALSYIYHHYHFQDYTKIQIQDKWTINVRKLTDFKWNFYDKEIKNLSKKIPHGVKQLQSCKTLTQSMTNYSLYLTGIILPH